MDCHLAEQALQILMWTICQSAAKSECWNNWSALKFTRLTKQKNKKWKKLWKNVDYCYLLLMIITPTANWQANRC